MITRRTFLKNTFCACAGTMLSSCISGTTRKNNPTILAISGWQDVNIGDIAHTPGLLHILEEHFPESDIILWKMNRSEAVEELISRNFPKVRIIFSPVGSDFVIQNKELLQVMEKADIFIHGSGPFVVAAKQLEAWRKLTTKPYGIFGTTIDTVSPQLKDLLSGASFIFTRETASLKCLEEASVTGPAIRFVPDATFALHIRNDRQAATFMEENGLADRKFICVIPRLRKTPYWLIRKTHNYTPEMIQEIELLNDTWKEIDHAKAREAIITWVRETKNKVLLCPEMTYQVDIMDELIINPLPDDVKPFVIKRGYWMPDEAASLYSKAFCLLSFDCHSPIMALTYGTPAFYLRQPEDTIKGQMYYDLGVDRWVFEINESTGKQISDQLMEVYADYNKAEQYRKAAMDKAEACFSAGIRIINQKLNG